MQIGKTKACVRVQFAVM